MKFTKASVLIAVFTAASFGFDDPPLFHRFLVPAESGKRASGGRYDGATEANVRS